MAKKLLIFTLLIIFAFVGCGEREKRQAKRVDLDKREKLPVKGEESVITYAYLPQYAHEESYKRHHYLIEYLKQETGLNIKQIFPRDFDEHIAMVGSGAIDISYSNPFVYAKIAQRYRALAFARVLERYGEGNFKGQIIVRADSGINSIKDCVGRRWIAVDATSAGGYLFQLGFFYDNGIEEEDFDEIAFSPGPGGKQEKVVLAIYEGKYDVGSVRQGTLEVAENRYRLDISKLKVLASTQWYPGWVYSARLGLDPLVVDKIKQAFLKLDYDNPQHRAILDAAALIGIVDAADADFDSIRELAHKLNIDLD